MAGTLIACCHNGHAKVFIIFLFIQVFIRFCCRNSKTNCNCFTKIPKQLITIIVVVIHIRSFVHIRQ